MRVPLLAPAVPPSEGAAAGKAQLILQWSLGHRAPTMAAEACADPLSWWPRLRPMLFSLGPGFLRGSAQLIGGCHVDHAVLLKCDRKQVTRLVVRVVAAAHVASDQARVARERIAIPSAPRRQHLHSITRVERNVLVL